MRRSCYWLLLVSLSGCGDDPVGAGAEGSSSSGAESSTTDEPVLDSTGDADGDVECMADADCDDADPCTADVCEAGACTVTGPVLSLECRPVIEVEVPPRGATIQSSSEVVTVSGRVSSAAGSIEWLQVNGEDIALSDDGHFSTEVSAHTGGNTLVLTSADEHGVEVSRVQSFLWSTQFHKPGGGDQGMLDQGLAVYLDQQSIDDGDPSEPVNDLATLMGLALGAVDLGAFIDPTMPIANQAGYDIYVLGLTFDSSNVSLTSIDGGLTMVATLSDVVGDLQYEGVISSGGGFSIETISATVDLIIDVDENNDLAVAVLNPETVVDGLDIWADNGFLNFLITIIEPIIRNGLVADIEATLTDQLTGLMGPAVALALDAMAPNMTLSFPRIGDDSVPNDVRLTTDFHQVRFDDGEAPPEPSPAQGGLLVERGGALSLVPLTPYENLGVPLWQGCGEGPEPLWAPREAPLEILLTDDLLNHLLYGAWEGGMLEFDMPPELLGDDNALISDLEVRVSGMLAPTASECGPDEGLSMHMGDVRIDGSLMLGELPVTFVAYSSLAAGLEVVPTETGISITVNDVHQVDTELTVGEDEAIEVEPTLRAIVETQLVDGVIGAFGEGIGGIDLPELDLSGTLGLPPGTAAVSITAENVERGPGVSVIAGHL